jgi:ubiquinol-cytochrome c reductase cytochrome c1 subunit
MPIFRTLARILIALVATASAGTAAAAGAQIQMDRWPVDRGLNLAALQNGARLFANYCLGCHSASLVRWNRLQQIGLDDKQIRDFLIFGDQKVGDTIRIAAPPADLKNWFGKMPPDLSVITRARTSFDYRGTDYLYTLLRGYYRDASMPTGWNNVAYPAIGMPHVFWEEQGPREATIERIHATRDAKSGRTRYVRTITVFDPGGVAQQTDAELTGAATEGISYQFRPLDPARARQFDSDAADVVAFLAFITDPSARQRVRIGVWVMFFLALFTAIAWRLNAVYWKDIR